MRRCKVCARKEIAFHVFEMLNGMMISASEGRIYHMTSTFETPPALPSGFIGDGTWTRKPESALIGAIPIDAQ